MKKCKKGTCAGAVEPPGILYCAECRAAHQARKRAYLRANIEYRRADNRRKARCRKASKTSAAAAYRERHKPGIVAACAAWTARNRPRKALQSKLGNFILTGKIVKPDACEECGATGGPVVAWGLDLVGGRPAVEAWLCWSCWWRRRRGGRP